MAQYSYSLAYRNPQQQSTDLCKAESTAGHAIASHCSLFRENVANERNKRQKRSHSQPTAITLLVLEFYLYLINYSSLSHSEISVVIEQILPNVDWELLAVMDESRDGRDPNVYDAEDSTEEDDIWSRTENLPDDKILPKFKDLLCRLDAAGICSQGLIRPEEPACLFVSGVAVPIMRRSMPKGPIPSYDIEYNPAEFTEDEIHRLASQEETYRKDWSIAPESRESNHALSGEMKALKQDNANLQRTIKRDLEFTEIAQQFLHGAQLPLMEKREPKNAQVSLSDPDTSHSLYGPPVKLLDNDFVHHPPFNRALRRSKPYRSLRESGSHDLTTIDSSSDDGQIVADIVIDSSDGSPLVLGDDITISPGSNHIRITHQIHISSIWDMAPVSAKDEEEQIIRAIEASLEGALTDTERVAGQTSETIVVQPQIRMSRGCTSRKIIIKPSSSTFGNRTSHRNSYQSDSGVSVARGVMFTERTQENTPTADNGRENSESSSMIDSEVQESLIPGMVSTLTLPTKRFLLETTSDDDTDEEGEEDGRDEDLELAIAMSKEHLK